VTNLSANERAALEALEWKFSGPHSLDEIATRLGMSKPWVKQLERRALEKLRRAAMRRGLTFGD